MKRTSSGVKQCKKSRVAYTDSLFTAAIHILDTWDYIDCYDVAALRRTNHELKMMVYTRTPVYKQVPIMWAFWRFHVIQNLWVEYTATSSQTFSKTFADMLSDNLAERILTTITSDEMMSTVLRLSTVDKRYILKSVLKDDNHLLLTRLLRQRYFTQDDLQFMETDLSDMLIHYSCVRCYVLIREMLLDSQITVLLETERSYRPRYIPGWVQRCVDKGVYFTRREVEIGNSLPAYYWDVKANLQAHQIN